MATVISSHAGLPDITVLLTSSEEEATSFMAGWQGVHHFGLDLEWKPNFKKGGYSRAALLQICAGPWVLLFDLKAIRKSTPKPLPDVLWDFLENENHCFYGMGLTHDLARLAFEFDCVPYGIDFKHSEAWPGHCKGSLVACANIHLGTSVCQSKRMTMSNWDARPLSYKALEYVAEDAYLSWALARHLIKLQFPMPEWTVTMTEIYREGKQVRDSGNCVPNPVHDWSEAKREHDLLQDAKKAKASARKTARKAKKPQTDVQRQQGVALGVCDFASDDSDVDDYSHSHFPDHRDGFQDPAAKVRDTNVIVSHVSDGFELDDYFQERFPDYLRDERPDLDSDGLEDLYLQQMQDDAEEFGGQCDSD